MKTTRISDPLVRFLFFERFKFRPILPPCVLATRRSCWSPPRGGRKTHPQTLQHNPIFFPAALNTSPPPFPRKYLLLPHHFPRERERERPREVNTHNSIETKAIPTDSSSPTHVVPKTITRAKPTHTHAPHFFWPPALLGSTKALSSLVFLYVVLLSKHCTSPVILQHPPPPFSLSPTPPSPSLL